MPDLAAGMSAQFKVDNAVDWDTARDATSATASAPTSSEYLKLATASGGYDIYRGAMAFDTSAITIAPSACQIKLFGSGTSKANNIRIVKGNQAAVGDHDTSYVNGDFDQIVFGTPYSDEYDVSSWTKTDFNAITLNAAALSDIAALDSFEIWIVAEHDFDDVNPNSSTKSGPAWKGVAHGTASLRPKLTYTAGVAVTGLPLQGLNFQGSSIGSSLDRVLQGFKSKK